LAYIERPDKELLTYFRGNVSALKVEQYGARDQIWFVLTLTEPAEVTDSWTYTLGVGEEVNYLCIYLDIGTTVALAQLQMLRSALIDGLEAGVWAYRDPDSEWNFVYSVCIYPPEAPFTLPDVLKPGGP
jgi:hypothetical protein